MAIVEDDMMIPGEIRQAFTAAAARGDRYLLLITENVNDVYVCRSTQFTRGVKAQSAIVPLLRERQFGYKSTFLTAVFDTAADIDAQLKMTHDETLARNLCAQTKSELTAHYAAVAAEDERRKQARAEEEKAAKQGIFGRLFRRKP
ncbi:MAG: hypothetical protein GC185_03750 [Alphaproteobacteria bacterium]|nr:hypothetical protein [Alphaproteobacteria bacterium]